MKIQQDKTTRFLDTLFWIILLLFPIVPQYVYVVSGINLVNFLMIIFVAIFLLRGKVKIIKMPLVMLLFWGYLVFNAIMHLVGPGLLQAATYTLCFIVFPYALIGFLNTKQRFYKAIDVLICGGFLLGLMGLVESVTQYNFIQPFAADSTYKFFHEIRYGLLRIMTTFGQPIGYGMYQVFVATLIYYRLNTEMSRQRRRFLRVAYIVSVANIILSVSRIPILVFVITQIWLLCRNSKKGKSRITAAIIVVVLLIVIVCNAVGIKIPLVDDLLNTISRILDGNVESAGSTVGVGDRYNLWFWVYESVRDSWIWGKGIATEFAYQVQEWQVKASIENQYLYTLFHTGVVGLSGLLLSYFATLRVPLKGKKINPQGLKERGITFNSLMFVLLSTYYFAGLGVQESDMTRTYVIFIALLISYNRLIVKEKYTQQ